MGHAHRRSEAAQGIIDAGKQALTISPGDVQGVNGFAQPGDHVNVIVTVDIEFGLTAVGESPIFGIPGDTGGDGTEGEAPAKPWSFPTPVSCSRT